MRRVSLVVVLLLASLPAAAQSTPTVERRDGDNRHDTAALVSAATFASDVDDVWVATSADFPDALSVGPVAGGSAPGPVLLVERTRIPAETADELRRLDPARITVLGGPNAVSADVVADLESFTDGVVRQFNEQDRFATAARVAREFAEDREVERVFVATGRSFADALGGGAAAAVLGAPLVLVERTSIPTATADVLGELAPDTITVLGGPVAITELVVTRLRSQTGANVERIAGDDRYDTAARISADAFPDTVDVVHLATGENFPDALAATPAAARAGGPLLLTRPDCLPDVVADELARLDPSRVVVLGGPAVVSDAAATGTRCSGTPEPDPDPVALRVSTVTSEVEVPWDVAFTPDGRTFVTERDTGNVLELADDGTTTVVDTFTVDNASEGGLLGLTTSPTWADDGLLYAYMTTNTDNRVVRFRPGEPASREVVIDGIRAASTHDAGRIAFGPDGRLYIGTGDAQDPQGSQNLSQLHGKILRLEPDGGIPFDNPFGNAVWAYGFRDPQGLTWTADGTMFASEFGPDRDDEINRVRRGGNYGWPDDTGDNANPDHVDPIFVQQPPNASWSGMTALVDSAIPQWEGDLFVAALRGQRVWRLDLDADDEFVGAEVVFDGRGRMRHAAQAPDGSLWLLTSNLDGRGNPADGEAIYRIGP